MRSFVKIKLLRNGEITLSFTDIGKSCHSCDFLASQICLSMHIVKNNSRENFRIYSSSVYAFYCRGRDMIDLL